MLLLDADGLVYAIGFMAQHKKTDGTVELMDFNLTKKILLSKIENIGKRFDLNWKDSNQVRVFLAGQGNYRNKIATLLPYKGNRKPENRPVYYSKLMQVFIDMFEVERAHGQEADDLIGIRAYSIMDPIVCSRDKDLKMIAGTHYDWKKDIITQVSEIEALRWFGLQLVTGDLQSDNVPGIYTQLQLLDRPDLAKRAKADCYIKKTTAMLKRCNTYQEIISVVKNIYNMYGLPLRNLEEVGQLVWIRRKPDEMWSLKWE